MIEVGAGAPAEVTAMFGAAPASETPAAPQPAAPAPGAGAPPAAPPRLAPLSAPRPSANAIQ
jgi:hypothetical protein